MVIITIDTTKDSPEDIKKAIVFLQGHLGKDVVNVVAPTVAAPTVPSSVVPSPAVKRPRRINEDPEALAAAKGKFVKEETIVVKPKTEKKPKASIDEDIVGITPY
jgi:hypothetical protein